MIQLNCLYNEYLVLFFEKAWACVLLRVGAQKCFQNYFLIRSSCCFCCFICFRIIFVSLNGNKLEISIIINILQLVCVYQAIDAYLSASVCISSMYKDGCLFRLVSISNCHRSFTINMEVFIAKKTKRSFEISQFVLADKSIMLVLNDLRLKLSIWR